MRRREFLILPAAGQTKGAARGAWAEVRLWYRQPAANWNEALPVGNGRLAAMLFGGFGVGRLQINEETVWAGERRDRTNPDGARSIPEVRRLLFAGKVAEAEALAEQSVIAVPKRMPPYQPLGDLCVTFAGHERAEDYVRELDIDAGETRTLSFTLRPEDLAPWDRSVRFVVEPGAFRTMVGSSSEDIRLTGEFQMGRPGGDK